MRGKKITLVAAAISGLFCHLAIGYAEDSPVVAVFCYHRFKQYLAQDDYYVSPAQFQRQVEVIREEGFVPISMPRYLEAMQNQGDLPAKAAVVTFDDGYRDFMELGLPVLDALGIKATLFVYTAFVGTRSGFKPADLAALASAGHTIGSHTATHPKLPKFQKDESAGQRLQRLQKELAGSREKLEKWSGAQVTTLAYPYGVWDQSSAQVAKDAGYQALFTVDRGLNTLHYPRERLKRIMVLQGMSEQSLRNLLRERPLKIVEYLPQPGSRTVGAVPLIRALVAPEQRGALDPARLLVRSGKVYAHTFDPASGILEAPLNTPWRKGVHMVEIEARTRAGLALRENWLFVIDAQQPGMEK
jgi:peptidoglycan/xylan/chitin deacetylase (PgdA/CDA1 family)